LRKNGLGEIDALFDVEVAISLDDRAAEWHLGMGENCPRRAAKKGLPC
jgi:hypothetical protein